jgi:hypothetical protein
MKLVSIRTGGDDDDDDDDEFDYDDDDGGGGGEWAFILLGWVEATKRLDV